MPDYQTAQTTYLVQYLVVMGPDNRDWDENGPPLAKLAGFLRCFMSTIWVVFFLLLFFASHALLSYPFILLPIQATLYLPTIPWFSCNRLAYSNSGCR